MFLSALDYDIDIVRNHACFEVQFSVYLSHRTMYSHVAPTSRREICNGVSIYNYSRVTYVLTSCVSMLRSFAFHQVQKVLRLTYFSCLKLCLEFQVFAKKTGSCNISCCIHRFHYLYRRRYVLKELLSCNIRS